MALDTMTFDRKRLVNPALALKKNSEKRVTPNHDEQTGLVTKSFYERSLKNRLVSELSSPLLVIFFDLDNLKLVNDTFGHSTGDSCIQAFASVLKKSFRNEEDSDILIRNGGDEFLVLAPVLLPEEEWPALYENLISRFSENLDSYNQNIQSLNGPLLACSAGHAFTNPKTDKTIGDTVDRADFSMYSIKRLKKSPPPQVSLAS